MSSNIRIISWNVNGLRSPSMNLLTKNKELNNTSELYKLIQKTDPDIVCINETKCQVKNEEVFNSLVPFKYKIWNSSTLKLGYSGVAIFSKIPFHNLGKIPGLESDTENSTQHLQGGRTLFLEFDDFFLVHVYVPNTGNDKDEYRKNVWNPAIYNFLSSEKFKTKPLIYCGDLNVVSDVNDIYNPGILNIGKSPGVKKYEREEFKKLLDELNYTDAMRFINPEGKYWTWWDTRSKARDKDNGWRLDYFLVSDKEIISDCKIHNDVYGSDHCPISLDISL